MPQPHIATQTLDREFLDIRSRILEIAAALDRIERAADAEATLADDRMSRLRDGIAILIDGRPDRTGRVQMSFSDPYDARWRDA